MMPPGLPEAQAATQETELETGWPHPFLLTLQTQPCSDESCPLTWLGQQEVAGHSPGLRGQVSATVEATQA